MEVMLDEAKKQTNGTSIDLGGEKTTTKELDLFVTGKQINADLKQITSDKATKYEVINVISNFQPIGTEVKAVTRNYAFVLALLGAGLMILFLLTIRLNSYLTGYNK